MLYDRGVDTIDLSYLAQLQACFPSQIVSQLEDSRREAALPHLPGQNVPYVHMTADSPAHERPVAYVGGFGETVFGALPFIMALAQEGFEVVMPDQHRKGILRNGHNADDAILTQARNCLSVFEDAANQRAPEQTKQFDVVAHSLGALVVQQMVELSPETFRDARVVFLSPAGSIAADGFWSLARRWVTCIYKDSKSEHHQFSDSNNMAIRAGVRTLTANIKRTMLEIKELARTTIDYVDLASKVGSLTVASYANDTLFSPDRLTKLHQALNEGVPNLRWLVPVSFSGMYDPLLGVGGSNHGEERSHPGRIAGMVNQILTR